MKTKIITLSLLVLIGCSSNKHLEKAVSNLEEKTERQEQEITKLYSRLDELTNNNNYSDFRLENQKMLDRIDGLKDRFTDLWDEIRKLQAKTGDEKQKQYYLDNQQLLIQIKELRKSISEIESKQVIRKPNKPKVRSTDNPTKLYKEGRKLFTAGIYRKATKKFEMFADKHPKHKLLPNAKYWLGESYFSLKEYSKSITVFEDIIENHSKSQKAPDAYIKLAIVYKNMDNPHEAKATLQELLKKFPKRANKKLTNKLLKKLQ